MKKLPYHKNIIGVKELLIDFDNGRVYLIMDYFHGIEMH